MSFRIRVAAAFFTLWATSVQAAEEHGKIDVFAAPGVALAWAVARGADEAGTFVVIRIAADSAAIGALSVTGSDPFTKAERVWMRPTNFSGRVDVRLARAGFADFPRTELRFYPAGAELPAAKPLLTVFYLGIPDTTPEFNDTSRLDAYLDDRVAKARAGAAR